MSTPHSQVRPNWRRRLFLLLRLLIGGILLFSGLAKIHDPFPSIKFVAALGAGRTLALLSVVAVTAAELSLGALAVVGPYTRVVMRLVGLLFVAFVAVLPMPSQEGSLAPAAALALLSGLRWVLARLSGTWCWAGWRSTLVVWGARVAGGGLTKGSSPLALWAPGSRGRGGPLGGHLRPLPGKEMPRKNGVHPTRVVLDGRGQDGVCSAVRERQSPVGTKGNAARGGNGGACARQSRCVGPSPPGAPKPFGKGAAHAPLFTTG